MANRALRWTGIAFLGLSLTTPLIGAQHPLETETFRIGTTASPAITDQSAVLKIRILVYDQAGIPGKTLMEAQRLASSAFREAAMELLWLDGEQSSVSETDFILRIHCCFEKLNTRLHRRTVAFAPAGGRHITVFWDRIRTEAAAGSHPEELMLGYVLAHELAHLFLPPGYHSPYGIMQSRLNYDDWSEARRAGNLRFLGGEASRMRVALIARSR